MRIAFIEIQNFRKLKSVRIDFAAQTTVFVGANNSGKTSAMVALRHFLVEPRRFKLNDFTLSNWKRINAIAMTWEKFMGEKKIPELTLKDWEPIVPTLDLWLEVGLNEVHHVNHLIPTLDWEGGFIGVRLRYEPKDLEALFREYITARKAAKETLAQASQKIRKNRNQTKDSDPFSLWPNNLIEFLDRRSSHFSVKAYILDPEACSAPKDGVAQPQDLPPGAEPLERDPFEGLIKVNEIDAQRGLSDASGVEQTDSGGSSEYQKRVSSKRLSEQMGAYYARHLDPNELPEPSDVKALEAIHFAQSTFDLRLEEGFKSPLAELTDLGYPGINDPKIKISTRLKPVDGLNHPSALQYEVTTQNDKPSDDPPLRLPEQYSGLGYQNLISLAFRLMSYRDNWMKVGKAGRVAARAKEGGYFPPPLHLVLVEEPEAHLHAQVQQVFIRNAYDILRNHKDLGKNSNLSTQLIISTHSSHIAHECDYAWLRYFRRIPAMSPGEVPTTVVVNLTEVFGTEDTTQKFVTRYLQSTHCDLFFADAAILVEGAAERMLIPHFIRIHFPYLQRSYLTILEIGGSHAHKLRHLIEHLGLITLIVTDLDPASPEGRHPAERTEKGKNQVTTNPTLKDWIPEKKLIDQLLDLPPAELEVRGNRLFAVRVAYQHATKVSLGKPQVNGEVLPYTFEDSLVCDNIKIFKSIIGEGSIAAFHEAVTSSESIDELSRKLYEIVGKIRKAEFALDLLNHDESEELVPPKYIHDGLTWLQDQLEIKEKESLPSATVEHEETSEGSE